MTITIKLKKNKTLKSGEHPLVLRIAHKKDRALVWLGISCSEELWDFKKNAPKRHHPNKELIENVTAQTLNTYRTALLELVDQQKIITPHTLIEAVETANGKKEASKVFHFFDRIIDRFLQSGQVGNANVYKDTKRSLKLFSSSKDLLFTDIDQTFLSNYEVSLRKLNLAETSMSVYFRTLRALFNKAIKERFVPPNYYPFNDFSVAKFNTATKKRAFTIEDMKKIADLEIDPASSLWTSRLWFMFGYYGQGINFIDIAKLKWKNLENDYIFYARSKTGSIIQFKLFTPAKAMIEHYRPLTGSHPDNYIFPILDRLKHITPIQINDRIARARKKMNNDMRQVAKLAGVKGNPTSYVPRHTWATAANNVGAPVPAISQAMGHKSIKTTQIYLKEIDTKVIEEFSKQLLL
jgi:integrase